MSAALMREASSRKQSPFRVVRFFLATVFTMATVVCIAQPVSAQDASDLAAQSLAAGEFSNALDLANSLPAEQADRVLGQISNAQFHAGATDAAVQTLRQVTDDQVRGDTFARFYRRNGGGDDFGDSSGGGDNSGTFNDGGNRLPGGRGGITEADFDPLIDLIKSTIAPDDWDDTNGDGTIQPFISGVFVDSSGLMSRIKPMSERELRAVRNQVEGAGTASLPSDLRKISLTRLEREAQLLAAQGQRIPDEMKYLGGMTEIRYLMFFPETNDIVIAGPAGPWTTSPEGRVVNTDSGHPVLHLDDLVVCLRNARKNGGKFGCTITPRQTSLARTKQFISTTKLKGKPWRDELRRTLGRQDVEVFGIDPRTHAGRVIVEADYHMKLLGMGLEPSVADVPSYLSRIDLEKDGQLPPMDVIRWWFTLSYDNVTTDQAGLTFKFNGPGVKVLSENELVNDQGERIHTFQSKSHTRGFARDFTRHFDKVAARYPVYRQLKNVFDLSLVASLIEQQRLADEADWHLTYFGDQSNHSYRPKLAHAVREVDSVMNHRIIRQRKASSTLKHTVVGISGGVLFDANQVIARQKMRTDSEGVLDGQHLASQPGQISPTGWYWD